MTLAGHSYEAHLHNSKCSEDDIRWSQRFSFVLRRFHYIFSFGRLFSQKKHLKVPELCRSDVGYLWLLFKSARTYWTTYLRWTRSFARKIWITYERPHGIHIPGSLILKAWRHFSWFGQRAKTCWDFQDKMSTKNWNGQNANHRKKSGRNANQKLAFCPDFFLWLAFCPSQILVGILSGPS